MEDRSALRNAVRSRKSRDTRSLVTALERGFRVFEAVADAGPAVGLADLADRVDLPKTTVHRLLQTLVGLGYVEPIGDGNYRSSSRVLVVAGQIVETVGYPRLIGSALRELRASTRDTIHVGMLRGFEAVYVEKLEGSRPYQMLSQVGKPIPLHSTSIGKAILAFLPTEERDSLLDRLELAPRTSRTITSRSRLEQELRRTRVRGYSLDDEEDVEGIRCIGVVVFDYTGRAIGAISISAQVFDLPLDRAELLAHGLRAAGKKASEAMGAGPHLLAIYDAAEGPHE